MICWGADIGFRRVSIAAVDENGLVAVHTRTLPSKHEIGHAETFVRLMQAAAEIAEQLPAPDICIVEKPGGSNKPRPGKKFTGVSQEMHWSYALVSAALHAFGPTEGMMPASWKSAALGKGFGHADKDEVMAWARRFGYAGSSKDEADAIGIARAGVISALEPPPPDQLALT